MNKEMYLEQLNNRKQEITELIQQNGEGMYKGIYEVIDKLMNSDEVYNELVERVIDECDGDEEMEDMKDMLFVDSIDLVIMEHFMEQFYSNLIELGYKYDEDDKTWDIKNDEYDNQTNYGLIWDYWYELDTNVRENLSDLLDESF